jgi:nucleoside-diphosphate-sugar epimerase
VRVLVAGAAGVIGRPLAGLLAAAGHEVTALTRSRARQEQLRAAGAAPVTCDALDAAAPGKAVGAARPEVVVNQLTALPRRISPRHAGRDLAAAGVPHFLAQSVAFAYAPGGGPQGIDGRLRREADPLYRAARPAGSRRRWRRSRNWSGKPWAPRGSAVPCCAMASSTGPGPPTPPTAGSRLTCARRFPVLGDGAGVFCFIHVEDAAQATLAAVEQRAEGVYNNVDDEPAAAADWCPRTPRSSAPRPRDGCRLVPAYAAILSAPPPRRLPTGARVCRDPQRPAPATAAIVAGPGTGRPVRGVSDDPDARREQ